MDVALLENRLKREKAARQQAENLLEEKSYELYCSNKALQASADEFSEQSEELNIILDNTAAAIFVVSEDKKILRSNRVAKKFFGEKAASGGEWVSLFDGDNQDIVTEIHSNVLANSDKTSDMAETYECEGLDSDNKPFPMETAVARIVFHDAANTVWICRDLTKQHEADRKREKLEQDLRQAQKMEALGTLASGVAHEINTPIQFISDNLRFLEDSFDDINGLIEAYKTVLAKMPKANMAKLQETLDDAEEDADLEYLQDEVPESIKQSLDGIKRIGEIVSAIKDFSHPSKGELASVDLNKAIETTIIVSRNQWKYVSNLETDLAENLPTILGNVGDMNQVLLNLIVNAAHAIESNETGKLGSITIKTYTENNTVYFSVTDTGCGIPKENRAKIFDPFFTTKKVGVGTGQGLSILYNIVVTKHGGTIDLQSEEGVGSCFTVGLPVAEHSPKDAGDTA